MSSTRSSIRRTVAALGVAAVALLAVVETAGAAKPYAFSHTSIGTHVVAADGSAEVTSEGNAYRRNKDLGAVQVAARLAADDGTLPEPGVCEPATATVTVTQDGALVAELTGTGQVCGKWIQPPTYYLTHVFTGRYEITAGGKGIAGTDGWFSVRLFSTGVASTESYDT